MSSPPCTLELVLVVINDHFDELRKWNHGGIMQQLKQLNAALQARPLDQQDHTWLESLVNRSNPLVGFLLDKSRTNVGDVQDAVEQILRKRELSMVRGPSARSLGDVYEMPGTVVNSTVLELRRRVEALIATPEVCSDEQDTGADDASRPSETPVQ